MEQDIVQAALEPKPVRGSIWWCDMPTDPANPSFRGALRPVIIVSPDGRNLNTDSVIACPLTTKKDKYWYIHPAIKSEGDRISFVKTESPRLIAKDQLGKYVRTADEGELKKMDRAILESYGMPQYRHPDDVKPVEVIKEVEIVKEVEVVKEVPAAAVPVVATPAEPLREIDEDALAIGTHVKAIFSLLNVSSPVKQKSESAETEIDFHSLNQALETFHSASDKVSVPLEQEAATIVAPSPQLPDPTQKSAASPATPKKFTTVYNSGDPKSAIDKFQARFAKFQNMQSDRSHSTPKSPESSELSSDDSDPVARATPVKRKRRPGPYTPRHYKGDNIRQCDMSPPINTEHMNATKWTQDKIRELSQDVSAGKMTDRELADKYGVQVQTIRTYISKIRRGVW